MFPNLRLAPVWQYKVCSHVTKRKKICSPQCTECSCFTGQAHRSAMASTTWLKHHTMFDVYRSQSVRRSFRHPENNVSVAFAMVTSLKSSLFSVHGPVHESRVQVLYHPFRFTLKNVSHSIIARWLTSVVD